MVTIQEGVWEVCSIYAVTGRVNMGATGVRPLRLLVCANTDADEWL